jgi:PAS domain S-box-containing protein
VFFPKLSQVATRDVITLEDSHTIQEAVHLMYEHNIRDVIVEGSSGLRILTARELIEFRVLGIDFATPLKNTALNNVPQMSPDASVVDGLAVIKNHPDEHLCLVENGKLCGIVSYTDLASCLDPQHLAQTKSIGELVRMTRVIRVRPHDTVEWTFLELNRVKQAAAIVVDDEAHPIGIITQSDIIDLLDHEWQSDKTVEQAMTSPLITFQESMTLQEALTLSRKKRIKRLVVVDSENRISGILHQKDLVALVYQDWSDLLQNQKRQLKTERDLFAGGPVSVIIWRAESGWPVEFVSDNISNLLGYRAEDLTAEHFKFVDIVHPEDLKRISKEVGRYVSERRLFWEQHYRVIDNQGKSHWLYDYTRAEYDEDGELVKLYGYLLDQTEQVKTRKTLEQTQERLASIINQSNQIIWEIDANGLYTFISPAVENVLGYQPQELINKVHYYKLHPESNREQFKVETLDLLARGVSINDLENPMQAKNGEVLWFSTTGQPVLDRQGRVIGYRGVDIDITDRKMVEQKIAESEERWRSVLESTDQGVWDWNAQSNKVYFSDKWKTMLGYQVDEVGNDLDEWSSRVHPEDLAKVEADLQAHFEGKTDCYENVHRVLTKSGEYKWILDRGRVLSRDVDGNPLRVIGTHTDVTERREEKERLNRIAENVPGMIYQFVLYPDGRSAFPYCSQGVESIYGVKPEQIKDDAALVYQSVHPEDLPRVNDSILTSAKDLSIWRDEYRCIIPQKGEIWVSGQATPTRQEDGSVLWHGYIFDITEQKKAQQTIEQQQQRLAKAQQVAKLGSWELDHASGDLVWSDELFRIFELDAKTFKPSYQAFLDAIHPDDREMVQKAYKDSIANQTLYAIDYRLLMPDGRVKWVREIAENEFDAQGQQVKSHGTVQDITEQFQVEQKLKLSESRYQDLVENHPYMINRYLPDTTMVFVNKSMAQFFGTTAANMQGQRWIEFLPEEMRDQAMLGIEACSPENPTGLMINEVTRFDGQTRKIKWNNRAFFNEQGQPTHFQSVGFDITEQLEAEQAIKREREKAEEANRAKSEFLANMSHEIRTPMNAVLGLSELVLKEALPPKARLRITKILQSGRALLDVINDILDFSKIESGQLEIKAQPFYLDNLLAHLSSLFGELAGAKHLKLVWDVQADLPEAFNADEVRLRQVLTNLLGNAIKFTQQGEVRMHIKLLKQDNHQAWLLFEVHDTGPGISQQDIDKLFRPFSQVDTTNTRQYGGTGLGLVISQRLVTAMGGGQIKIKSELGQGSCFSFSLPMAFCNDEQIAKLKHFDSHLMQTRNHLTGQVLLVEDNEINQEVAREMLINMGLNVYLANDGEQAVEMVKARNFDAVLMDIQMPKMDGYQATKAIRQFNPDVPIIALTAAAMVEDQQKANEAGMNAHLGKPIESTKLYHVLSQWLEEKAAIPHRVSSDDSLLFDMDGFDIDQGLSLLQGNRSLYIRLLTKFADQLHSQFMPLPSRLADLELSTDDENWREAQTLAHGLKGVAGNLGAVHLAELATYIDQQLKERQPISPRTVKAIEGAMLQAEQAIRHATSGQDKNSDSAPAERVVNVQSAREQLTKLMQTVKQSEYVAYQDIDELFQLLPIEYDAIKVPLITAIEQFDFEQANQLLTELSSSLK